MGNFVANLRESIYKRKIIWQLCRDFKGKEHTCHPDVVEAVRFIRRRKKLWIFPSEAYQNNAQRNTAKGVEVFHCQESGLHYVFHDEKRLYFHAELSKNACANLYIELLNEQFEHSPHRYTDDEFTVEKGSVLFDAGSAEGIFGLSHIETVSRLYLFECDPLWIPALEMTFRPWSDKVTIVEKFVGNVDDATHTTLDAIPVAHDTPIFIKIDIEGEEANALAGAKRVISESANCKLAVCCYHREEDEALIRSFFEKRHIPFKINSGVMLFHRSLDDIQPPYFRRGVLKAHKHR